MLEIIAIEEILPKAQALFTAENGALNPIWRIMRLPTVADILHQHSKMLKYHIDTKQRCATVDIPYDDVFNEFLFIVNYGVIGHIQITKGSPSNPNITAEQAIKMYNTSITTALQRFDKEAFADFMTLHFFYECIGQIVYELKLHNGDRRWDAVADEKRFLDIIVYGLCGAQLII